MSTKKRPVGCSDEHLNFLDELRESGCTNMFGATPYLSAAFYIEDPAEARAILSYWMETFGEENR